MGQIRKPNRHREGVVMVLQQFVSVLALVQSRYHILKLLQSRVQVLLSPPPSGQVGLRHSLQRVVVANICTLTRQSFTNLWANNHDISSTTECLQNI